MVQLRKKLLLILLIICFCLFQSEIVYTQGVTIQIIGDLPIMPHPQPTTPVPTTPKSPTFTNNSNMGTSNLTNLNSSNQKINNSTAGQSSYNPVDPTELTKELIRPATFSPLSDEPVLPNAEPYIVTVCLSGCFDKVTTTEQASGKLAGILLNRYFNGSEARPFRIVLPSVMPADQQKQLLHQIEIQAMTLVETRIFKSNGTFIKEYDKVAREEAERGVNWSHTSKDDKSIHDFYTKKAFTKLNNIAIQEKNPSSKNFKKN